MTEAVTVAALRCTCEQAGCGYVWLTLRADAAPPLMCPRCKSRAWDGEKKTGRPALRNTPALAPIRRVRDLSDY